MTQNPTELLLDISIKVDSVSKVFFKNETY